MNDKRLDGAPEEIRTPDPQIRSLLLIRSVSGDGESRRRGDALRRAVRQSTPRFGNLGHRGRQLKPAPPSL
jgi:hypothetical protein